MIEFIQPTLTALGSALNIVKQGKDLAPEAPETKELQSQLEEAVRKLETYDSEIAKTLGYELCKCTYPPQIMLFDRARNSDVCPSCGHALSRGFIGAIG